MKKAATLLSILLIATLLLGTSGCQTAQTRVASSLEGSWLGREPGNSPETPRELVFSGSNLEYRGAVAGDWGKGRFTLKEDSKPRELFLHLTECGAPEYAGKTVHMIYKLENGTLTASAYEPGNPSAPAQFNDPSARTMIFTRIR